MLNVIGIGDNVCDKYRNLNMMFPGGQALNFAVYCRQMGFNCSYMGVFGDDYVANHVISTLKDLKIDISRCKSVHGENGYAIVDVIEGDRVFISSNKGGVLRDHPIKISEEDMEYLNEFQLIHTSNNSYIDTELEKLASLKGCISYDFSTSWDYNQRTENICKYIDFAFMSCSNQGLEEIKKRLVMTNSMGTKVSVATRGSDGSIIYDGENFFINKPKLVKAIDTLGAGDSFAAAFMTSYISKMGVGSKDKFNKEHYMNMVRECIDFANERSANTCMIMGAFGYGTEIIE